MKFKPTIASIGVGAVALTGAGVDSVINPYDNLGNAYGLEVEERMLGEGATNIEIKQDKPEVRIKKWNNEVDLGISYDIKGNGKRTVFSNRVEYSDESAKMRVYPLDADNLEIDLVLDKKPRSNVFTFTIDGAEDLVFYKQLPLNVEMNDQSCTATDCQDSHRPEDIVNSMAVYHKSKKWQEEGSTNYGAGKIAHIKRIKAIDADGVEVWGDMNYTDGKLDVTVSDEWLGKAVYPVTIDPTFGYDTIGGSNSWSTGDAITYSSSTSSGVGTLDTISWYGNVPTDHRVKVGLYLTSDGSLDVTSSEQTGKSTRQWHDFTMSSEAISNVGYYLYAFYDQDAGCSTTLCGTQYDTTVTDDGGYSFENYDGTPPDPMESRSSTDRRYSIYATYTASGESPPTITTNAVTTFATSTATASSTPTWNDEDYMDLFFEYGTATGVYTSTTTLTYTASTTANFTDDIASLTPNDQYFLRAGGYATSGTPTYYYGSEVNFTTDALPAAAGTSTIVIQGGTLIIEGGTLIID